MSPEAARPPRRPSRRALRAAAGLWIAFGLVVWNVLFDRAIDRGIDAYLNRQALHLQGKAPLVTMGEIMEAAKTRGFARATAWGLGVTVAGLVALGYIGRPRA